MSPTKDEVARELARKHYEAETGLTHVIRIGVSADVEFQPNEPIKLLEVNKYTIPSGIMPLQFGPSPASGIPFRSVIVEVTPDEYERIQKSELSLPDGWMLGEEIPRPDPERGE